MSYVPTTWDTGDVITAQKMNNIEAGIQEAGGCLICTYAYDSDFDEERLDKTVQEIYDAVVDGIPVYVRTLYGTLGPSGTGSYSSNGFLAPVTCIYGYNYDSVIRICVSMPYLLGSVGNVSFTHSPAIWMLQASSIDDHPVSYKTVYVPAASISIA